MPHRIVIILDGVGECEPECFDSFNPVEIALVIMAFEIFLNVRNYHLIAVFDNVIQQSCHFLDFLCKRGLDSALRLNHRDGSVQGRGTCAQNVFHVRKVRKADELGIVGVNPFARVNLLAQIVHGGGYFADIFVAFSEPHIADFAENRVHGRAHSVSGLQNAGYDILKEINIGLDG